MPSLSYPYFLYDFLNGTSVQHTNWNSKSQVIKHIIVTPGAMPSLWTYFSPQPPIPIPPIFSSAFFYRG